MSWQTEDGTHEGWVAPTFADGALGTGSLGGGVLVSRIGDRTLAYDQWQSRPETDVTGWVMACECGWRGQPWVRVTDPARQDLAARRVYAPDSDAELQIGDACHAEWKEHLRPHQALAEVTALANEYAETGRRLRDAVGRARAAGVSCTAIGDAAGITGRAAHERWHH